MAYLLYFTNRACADAHWAAKRSRNSKTGSRSSPDQPVLLPRNVKQRTSDDEPPVCKAPRAESPVLSDASSQAGTSSVVSAEEYDAPLVPQMRSASFSWRRHISPVLLPLPRFATQSVTPHIRQSSSVATQKYPSSPVSRSSTLSLDLSVFDSECSESVTVDSPVSAIDVDWGVVDSLELGEVIPSGMSTIMSRFSSLNPQLSPVSMISVPQIVVESPTSYEAPVGSKDVCPAADRVVPLLPLESQVSQL